MANPRPTNHFRTPTPIIDPWQNQWGDSPLTSLPEEYRSSPPSPIPENLDDDEEQQPPPPNRGMPRLGGRYINRFPQPRGPQAGVAGFGRAIGGGARASPNVGTPSPAPPIVTSPEILNFPSISSYSLPNTHIPANAPVVNPSFQTGSNFFSLLSNIYAMFGFIPQELLDKAPQEVRHLLPSGNQAAATTHQTSTSPVSPSTGDDTSNHPPDGGATGPEPSRTNRGGDSSGRRIAPGDTRGDDRSVSDRRRGSNVFSYTQELRRLVVEASSGKLQHSVNPFALPLSMRRKGSLIPTSHITPLDSRDGWRDWIGSIKHILYSLNILGLITLPSEADNNMSAATRPWYLPDIDDNSDETQYRACDLWWELDTYAQQYLLGPVTANVRRKVNEYVFRHHDGKFTARRVYRALLAEYGTVTYDHGSLAWRRIQTLTCGTNIQAFVDRVRKLVDDIRDSAFDGTSPRSILDDVVNKLPPSLGTVKTTWDQQFTIEEHMDEGPATVTWSDIDKWLTTIERANKRVMARGLITHPPPSRSSQPRPSASLASPSHPSSEPKPLNKQAAVTCHNCGAVGHTKANCKEKPKQKALLADGGALTEHEEDMLRSIDEQEDSTPTTDTEEITEQEGALFAGLLDTISFDVQDQPFTNTNFFASCYLSEYSSSSAVNPPPTKQRYNTALDSGCSQHIFTSREAFHSFRELSLRIGTAGSSPLVAEGVGTIKFPVRLTNGSRCIITLPECLFAPASPLNLISVGRLTEFGNLRVLFDKGRTVCWESLPEQRPSKFFILPRRGFLTMLNCKFILPSTSLPKSLPPADTQVSLFATTVDLPTFLPNLPPDLELWHRRFGHPSFEVTRAVVNGQYADGIVCVRSSSGSCKCVICVLGRRAAQSFPAHGHRVDQLGDLVHLDVSGPFPVKTPSKERYFLSVLDDFTHFGWAYLMRSRDDSFAAYRQTEARIENITNRRVASVRLDNAKELTEGPMKAHLLQKGIAIQATAPYAHKANGVIERHIRKVQDVSACLMAESGLPATYWGFAILCAQYLLNRLPTSAIPDGKTPYEMLHGKKPDLSHLRVFGCRCFPIIPPELRRKGDARRTEATFLGYDDHRKGYIVASTTGKIFFARDVIFDEANMGRIAKHRGRVTVDSPTSDLVDTLNSVLDVRRSARLAQMPDAPDVSNISSSPLTVLAMLADAWDLDTDDGDTASDPSSNSSPPIDDIHAYMAVVGVHRMFDEPGQLSLASKTGYMVDAALVDSSLLDNPVALATVDPSRPPQTYKQASVHPDRDKWMAAFRKEYDWLMSKPAFEIVEELPPGAEVVDGRWVLTIKADGTYKTRYVLKGFQQRPSSCGPRLHAPVATMQAVRTTIAVVAERDWELFAFDITAAFTHSPLEQDIYTKQLPGFPLANPKWYLKLKVVLYGLRQAAFAWYRHILTVLVDIGMRRCELDHAFFIGVWTTPPHPSIPMPSDGSPLVLLLPIHVDDAIGGTNSPALWKWVISKLKEAGINVKDLGEADVFLGMKIIRDRPRRTIYLSQTSFIDNLLEEWFKDEIHGVFTPMEALFSQMPPMRTSCFPHVHSHNLIPKYQSLVGSLTYLATTTRGDISYLTMSLGRHNSSPEWKHLAAGKRGLRYLFKTRHHALAFRPTHTIDSSVDFLIKSLAGFSDADWASDPETRLSVSGFAIFYRSSLIAYGSKRQRSVAVSSTESEFYAAANVIKELLWFRQLLQDAGLPLPESIPVIADNRSTLHQLDSPALTSRSKHMHIQELFVKQYFEERTFSTHWINTSVNVADIFTKPLKRYLFEKHREALGIILLPLGL